MCGPMHIKETEQKRQTMKIHHTELSSVTRFINDSENLTLEDLDPTYEAIFRVIGRHAAVPPGAKILEIGSGLGWFQIWCARHGMACSGIDISPMLIESSKNLGRKFGTELNVELGNIEELDIGSSKYDVIVSISTFEHVDRWQNGLRRVFAALKPGGVFYFVSTNKFSILSGEYPLPFYSWLPDRFRYALRTFRQGGDIMDLGIDFNEFTYSRLRRFFRDTGFSHVLDIIDYVDTDNKMWKKAVIATLKRIGPLKDCVLLFLPTTNFLCIK